MGRKIVGKMRGMTLKAKAALTVFITIAVSVGLYWYLPMRAQANIVTYYLNPYTATSVGFDGTSNMTAYADIDLVYSTNAKRGLLDTNQPTNATRYRLYDFSGQMTFASQEFYRAYGPTYSVDTQIDANAFAEFEAHMVRTGGSSSVTVQLFDYNPADGTVSQIGGNVTKTLNASTTGLQRFNNGTGTAAYFGNSAYKMVAGHRLQVRFLVTANNAQPALLLYANPSNAPSGSARLVVNESTVANLTVSNGSAEPGNITIGPSPNGITSYPVDTFGLQLDGTAYDSITTVNVTMGAGSSQYISKVMITNTDNTTVYGSLGAPTSGETWTITTTSMPAYGLQASGDPVDYHVRIIPKAHSVIAPRPGGSYTITGRITAVTHSQLGTITYSDSGSSTITIDNTSPANPSWGAVNPGNGQVQLNWTNPVTDFAGVVILRNTESVTDEPIEGRSYAGGNYIGTAVVVYSGTGTSFTDTTAGNGTGFYYKIFAYDAFGNYSLGSQTGPFTPSNPNKTTPGAPSAIGSTSTSIVVTMPFTGDPNANNTYTVNYRANGAGGWTNHVTNAPHAANPYTTTISGLTVGQQYDVQCIYNDADGINVDPPTTSHSVTITAIDLPVYRTIPGAASASVAGTSTINVEMPYNGDINGNNTYLVEWEDVTVPGVWKSKSGSHSVNPYMTAIAGLAPGKTYNVRMTYQDPDGVSGGSGAVQTENGVTLQSATDTGILHNSQRFPGTTKWGGSWGVDGGQYGAFTCATCHQPSAPNIKATRGSFSAPEGTFPGGADTVIVFQNITSMGKDAGGHATSNRVCEACHSQTKFHRYNTAGQPGSLTHFNNKDCTECHPHNRGFRGSCENCHGNPPVTSNTDSSNTTGLVWRYSPTGATNPPSPGAHQRHAVSRAMKCATCHNQNTMPEISTTIQMGFAAYSANVPGFKGSLTFGNFSGRSPLANGYSFVASSGGTTVTTGATYTNSCSVACHGNWSGSNGTVYRPSWVAGASQANCGACHGATAAQSPTRGSHVKHASNAAGKYGLGCIKCHPSVADNAHVNGNVQWALNSSDARITGSAQYRGANSGGTLAVAPSGTYGQCTNLYCHSNGLNAASPTYGSPTWGTTLDCTGCHGSKATLATGSHGKHLVSAECANCHNVTITSGSTSLSDLSLHVNKSVNMQFPAGATLGAGATYGGSSMPLVKTSTGAGGFTTCSNVKCHNDGTGVWTGAFVAKTTPTWGQAGGCDKCHGNATYTDYRKAAPLYADGTPKPNAHTFHVDKRASIGGAGEIHCADCHSSVTASNTAINGSVPAEHANNVFNISQGAGAGTYFDGDNTGNSTTITVVTNWGPSPGVSNCVNVSCHPVGLGKERGTSQVNWNTKYKCIDCHSIGMESTDTFHHAMRNYSTSYPTAAPDGNSTNGTNAANRRCTMCHVDHDKFSPLQNPNSGGRAYNLRTGIGVTPTANSGFTNSDFVKDGTGGICISCHTQAKTKDTDRRRNDTGVTVTPVISYRNYTGSAHNYNVPAKMLSDGSIVNGNCSKCHNALQNETSLFMNITTAGGSTGLSFGNHNSGIRRLQGALGAAGGETAEEQVCYRCHSPYNPNESPGGGPTKPISGKDYYGGQDMIPAAENIYLNMKNAGSRTPSPTSSYTNKLFFKPGATQTDYMGVSYPQAPMPDTPANDGDQGDAFSGGSYIIRSMSPWDPTVSYASDIKSVTSTLSGLQRWEMVKFVSPPVAAPTTVPAGSWIINIYSRESSTSLNARVRYTVYKWAVGGADSMGATIIAKGTGTTELATTAAPGVNRQISVNVPATALNANEKIVVDLALETNEGTTSGARAGYFYFGMGAPSNLTLPGYVSWTYGDPGTNGFGHAAGAYAGIHKPSSTDETLAFISANRHVECGDCHNPHAVKGGAGRLHTKGSSVLAGVLREVSGAVPSYSSAVASTYYFTNGSPASPPGESQSTDSYGGGTFQVKDMSTSRGGGSVNQVTTTNPITLGTNFRGTAFISPTLSAGGIPGGTWTINMTSIESNAAANVALKGYIYLWKANSTKVAIAGPTTSVEVPTVKGNRSWTLTGSAVAVSAGDRLAVEVYPTIITANSGLNTYTGTMYWNGNVAGTDDSNVVTPAATGIWVPPVSYTQQTATAEYQICFKCHSGANSNYASWGGSGPLAWTDVGLEFSTQNKAAHPVMAALNTTNFPNSAGLITSTKMQTGWTATGTQIMTCSDCHASSAGGSMGPHGSAVRWMLAGTNKAWPFTSAAFNGTDGTGATTFKLGTISTNSGTDNGLFCLNCHKVTASSNTMHDNAGNGKHGWQSSARGACVSCHIRVPHGGKVKRLMRSTNTPARYMPNANGGEVTGQSQEVIRSYNGGTSFDDTGCGQHSGGSDTW